MINVIQITNTEKAFNRILYVLNRKEIPFQISGGFAAKIYGSPRPLNDIDIEVPDDKIEYVVPDVRQYIVSGPGRYKDERWDLNLMTLNIRGQEIDISGGYGVKICDARTGVWTPCPVDFSDYELREVFGNYVPVIPKRKLIEYKKMLVGAHQRIDIEAVEKSLSKK